MAFLEFPSKKIEELLQALRPETPALWGKMTAHHMVEHLILPLNICRGKLVVDVNTPPEKVDKTRDVLLLGNLPFRRNFISPLIGEGLMELRYNNIDIAKFELLQEIKLVLDYWQNNPNAIHAHPVFGPLNKDQWLVFQGKHFTHHFTQFGLV